MTHYHVYYGEVGGATNRLVTGNVLRGKLNGLLHRKNYFVYVTAVNAAGQESAPSNFVRHSTGEASQAPVLPFLPDLAVSPGQVLMCAITASDPDSPAGALTYHLISGPKGATLNAKTGLFTWRLKKSERAFSHEVVVAVSDDGSPPLSDSGTFLITVAPAAMKVKLNAKKSGVGALNWQAAVAPGMAVHFTHPLLDHERLGSTIHLLETSEDLVHWTPLALLNEFNEIEDLEAVAKEARFYRIRSESIAPVSQPGAGEGWGSKN